MRVKARKVLGAMVRLISEKWKWLLIVIMDMTIQNVTPCLLDLFTVA